MAEIRPFRGVRYNPARTPDLAAVICPPYDIISPQQQEQLYQTSPFNFIRIEYNQETAADTTSNNRYTRASAFLGSWLKENVLQQDQQSALYLHAHSFNCQGRHYIRQDILATVKLEEWQTRVIRPHENIIPKAKSDRMNILAACHCNTSPVLAMYADTRGVIKETITTQQKNLPVIDFIDPWGDGHQIWAVSQPAALQALEDEFASQPLYIADGHHRYDSALTYRREQLAHGGSNDAGYNYVMTSLIDFGDPGMVILPTHRLVKGLSQSTISSLKSRLFEYFEIKDIPVSLPDLGYELEACLRGLTPQMREVSIAVCGLTSGSISLLTLHDFQATNNLMPSNHGDLYKKLDVSLVDHIILERMLGFDKDKENLTLVYTHDRQEALEKVRASEFQLAFLLNPVGPEIIKGIADASDRMPRKSTYFYPKAPAGLVFFLW
jgi:uncharacterized protein (DUF1015 family)